MVRMGLVIFLGAIIVSIGVAIYAYVLYQPNFLLVEEGEPIQIGPVKYIISYEGQHNGNEGVRPENSFFMIRITAENLGSETTKISGGQFFLLDNNQKIEPIYGEFSQEDLFIHDLEPKKLQSFTTQFDIDFDEEKKYKIGIEARKEQSSIDIGIVCVLNC
jgi:hypothetical protein